MYNRQITFAREYRGLTQTKLASMVQGLSQSNLSKYEKGLNTLSEETIIRAIKAMNFPVEFLSLNIGNVSENRHYRKKASITVGNRSFIDRHISLIGYCVDWMMDSINIPPFKFTYIDIEGGISPEEVARHIRRKFHLGVEPIENLVSFLEQNGIIVYFWDCEHSEFDGVSLITDGGNHLVVVNKNRSNDRIRMTLAHELGHIIMHQCVEFFITESRDKETEAMKFAAEFLMPQQGIQDSLNNIKFKDLATLKQYWLVSMNALVVRAYNLSQIDKTKYTTLMTELSRRGWRTTEPYPIDLDEPLIISKATDILKDDLDYDNVQISEATKLPIDIVNEIFQLHVKMRILTLNVK